MSHFDEALTNLCDHETSLFAQGRSFEHLMQVTLSRHPGSTPCGMTANPATSFT